MVTFYEHIAGLSEHKKNGSIKKQSTGGGGGVNPPSGTVISASKTNKGKHKKEIQFAPKLDNISNI